MTAFVNTTSDGRSAWIMIPVLDLNWHMGNGEKIKEKKSLETVTDESSWAWEIPTSKPQKNFRNIMKKCM